ncbi:hypothetical protein AB0J80_35490 [Actinoplanes sp. NPDC049548]|uniref:hypothetical protein n=1 Tax=Actinoplanes sp. NPDC049548 TaxID=3155152 RepID=UPI00341B5713
MTRSIRLAALTAVTSLTAGVLCLPGAAYAADITTTLTAAQMVTALKSVAATSTTAAGDGWKITEALKGPNGSASGEYVFDPAAGVVYEHSELDSRGGAQYLVHHKGTYQSLSTVERAAVKMMNRPAVRYSFRSDTTSDFDHYVDAKGARPAKIVTDDSNHPGTRTTHDDGSADYSFAPDEDVTITYAVGPTGVLTEAKATMPSLSLTLTLTVTYGAEHVTLPPASATVNSVVLARGVAYVGMPTTVKQVAADGAAAARRAAGGHTVKASAVRKALRSLASAANRRAGSAMVRVEDVAGGARVHATNPWTHQTVAYTVKASGSKAVIRRA